MYSYLCELALWSASFGFYFAGLYFLFAEFDAPRPIRITIALLAGMLITKTYYAWYDTIKDIKRKYLSKH